MRRMDISKVLELSDKKKFEVACATFDIVDHILKVDIPSFLKGRKLAVQAINLLADGQLKYGFKKPLEPPPEETSEENNQESEVT